MGAKNSQIEFVSMRPLEEEQVKIEIEYCGGRGFQDEAEEVKKFITAMFQERVIVSLKRDQEETGRLEVYIV